MQGEARRGRLNEERNVKKTSFFGLRLLPQQRGLLLPPRSRRGRLLSPDGRRLERLEPHPGCLLLGVLVSGRYPLQGVERLVGARVGPGVMALVLL